jgi:hypothetical protein
MLPSVHKLLYAVFLQLHIFHEPVFKEKKLLFDPFKLENWHWQALFCGAAVAGTTDM